MPGVFGLQGKEQAIEVVAVRARRVTVRLAQGIDRVPQLRLQVGDQRRRQGHDKPFDILGKTITMNGQWRQDQHRLLAQLCAIAFDFKLCLTFEYEEQLA
ncbi:hypothetical protein D3C73_1180490 [compost metagenome]